MAGPPTGTVTFLFTDIEGSTRLWERDAKRMQVALARHDEILTSTIEEHGGHVFKTVGDAFYCAFPTAPDALEAALEAQRTLLSEEWEGTGPVRVRMAIHTGAAEERDGDYFGPLVNRVARLLSAAHGGQVLLSLPTHEMVRDQLPAGVALIDLGERRLKDLFRPERIFQLTAFGVLSEFPPLRTLESHPNNLPLQPTPLVGRVREVEEISGRLRSEEVRLLTLTGPGGTGKTRLALQAGADLLEEFEDGVFFVVLAAITDPELVSSTIAGSLGVKESAEQPLTETLKRYLQEKRLLLLLDNFEQVLEGASVVGELVAACPKLKILVTSRIPLRLYGEQEYMVPPLALPDPRVLPPVKVLTQYEAVRLFVERARAVKAEFEVTNESAPAIAEICARLDGLPLAIELAAARIRILPPQKMLQRLSNRLKLLKGGARDLPMRQQTLRGAIDWSYDLLEEEEKTLFERLSVFSGGRTLEAMEEICDPGGDLDVLEGVESLLEKSLLRQEDGVGEEPRFVMLETVHEFAREKLDESGEGEKIKRLHAQYFLALAEEAEPELLGQQQEVWFDRLEAEHDNTRAALSWALDSGEVDLALRLGGALWNYWYSKGDYTEGHKWLEEALTRTQVLGTSARAKALCGAGWLAAAQGDYQTALGYLEESLALFRELGDGRGVAWVLNGMAWAVNALGEHERSVALLEEALGLSREAGYGPETAISVGNLGIVAIAREDYEQAQTWLEEAEPLIRELGERQLHLHLVSSLGAVAVHRGEHERAKMLLGEALKTSWEFGAKPIIVECLESMAALSIGQGEDRRAAVLWGAAEAQREILEASLVGPEDLGKLDELSPGRVRLGDAIWEEALNEGRAMSLEEAVSFGLERVMNLG